MGEKERGGGTGGYSIVRGVYEREAGKVLRKRGSGIVEGQ
jgi:hypothetical protein